MSDEEFLTTTRARRSNAGSRLRQLLDMESDTTQGQTSSKLINEEDENIDLLFQEEGEDAEFVESEEEEEDDEGEEEDGEESKEAEEEATREQGSAEEEEEVEEEEAENAMKELESSDEAPVDSDDVLSDSDMSMSETDESEGEKELEKEEKQKKRKQKQQSKLIPRIKKFKPNEVTKRPSKPKKMVSADSLIQDLRRSSSRASAIENKQALIKRLQLDEAKRATMTPIVREKEPELTQEEKLAEAVETEKANLLSLEMFQQQEVVKKERQKQLLQLKRPKLTNVIRLTSQEQFITPNDEIETARKLYTMIRGKYKKRNIKRLKNLLDIDLDKFPGEIDEDLPYIKEKKKLDGMDIDADNEDSDAKAVDESFELEQKESVAEEKSAENGDLDEMSLENKLGEGDSQTDASVNRGEALKDQIEKSNEDVKDDAMEISKEHDDPKDSVSEGNNATTPEDKSHIAESAITAETQIEVDEAHDENPEMPDHKNDANGQTRENQDMDSHEALNQENLEKTAEDMQQDTTESEAPKADDSLKEGTHIEKKQKKVTFADDITSTSEPQENGGNGDGDDLVQDGSQPDKEEESESAGPKEVFEGPAQRVCRNTVYLLEFDNSKYSLNELTIKKILFGDQSILSGSRRFKDLKTILKIGNSNNPYVKSKTETDEMFTPATDLKEDNPMFEELNRLPKLGVRQEIVEETVEEDENDQDIVLTTEAPLGLYLPNGNKKICLITGNEVKYFDPSLGVPYSDVETFKFLKSVEQGNIPWYTFDSSFNDTGAMELYLGSKDGSSRLARGVPEGFDG